MQASVGKDKNLKVSANKTCACNMFLEEAAMRLKAPHRLLYSLCRLDHKLQHPMAFPVSSSKYAGDQEVHLLQRFPSTCQGPGFIALSCKIPQTELQQLLGRALGCGRTAVGMLRLSLYLGRISGNGEMRQQCHRTGCLSKPSIAGM